MPTVRCKYHVGKGRLSGGIVRGKADHKSKCPDWLADPNVRQRLLDEALVDPDAGEDSMGHPKRLWNAINNHYFVGVSTNEQQAAYNCYPEVPSVCLEELARRAERSLEDLQLRPA